MFAKKKQDDTTPSANFSPKSKGEWTPEGRKQVKAAAKKLRQYLIDDKIFVDYMPVVCDLNSQLMRDWLWVRGQAKLEQKRKSVTHWSEQIIQWALERLEDEED